MDCDIIKQEYTTLNNRYSNTFKGNLALIETTSPRCKSARWDKEPRKKKH